MICPKCGYDNKDTSKFCTHCGDPLLLSDKSPADAFTANQVWNMEIEQEQNKSNRRTALIVLAVAVVLIVGLVAAALFLLPEFGFGNGDWDDGHVEYDLTMCNIIGTADDEFLVDFPILLTFTYDNCYDELWAVTQERRLLEPYRTATFKDPLLQQLALDYLTTLDRLAALIITDENGMQLVDDWDLWYTTHSDLGSTIAWLQKEFGLFPEDNLHIPIYFAADGMSVLARQKVQETFQDALTGIYADWDSTKQAYTVTLTNNESYIAEVSVYNDYETEDDWLYEEDSFLIAPGETMTIVLEEMPDDFENWYVDLYVIELYCAEDYTLFEYCLEYFYEYFTE